MASKAYEPADPPAHGFSLPDANFEPWNNQAVRDYYKKKEQQGVLTGQNAVEDDVETEARQVVANWEKVMGRQATTEESERMMAKIRRIRAGAWLEGLKAQLVGETTVPIAYFNRLVAENEQSIAFVAEKMAEMSQERQEASEQINTLRGEILRLTSKGVSVDKDAEEKLQKAIDKNTELQEDNDRLRKELADGKPLADDKKEAECKEKIEKLESELRAVHAQRRERDQKIERLERDLRESRNREKKIKDEMKSQDKMLQMMSDREDEYAQRVLDLEKDLEKEKNKKKPSRPNSPSSAVNIARILKGLKEAKDRNQDLTAEIDILIDTWMSGVANANRLREYHNAVEEMKTNETAFRNRVIDLYILLGFDGTGVTADQALETITKQLAEKPEGHPMKTELWALEVMTRLHLEHMELRAERLKTNTLEMQLEMAKSDAQLSAETKMQYGIYDEAELERRVDSRTQMYRQHRRDILDHIFDASNELAVVAIRCTHPPTAERIAEIRKKYLDPTSLPPPKPQPRH
ncbi:hypothetical protein F4781DRAFT_388929 [Annulohypoxylon bovei var. microspora]|nr:hypothetical protein F4781DRAFT_388929 [Annulohypoxylon bovei var. microspora]